MHLLKDNTLKIIEMWQLIKMILRCLRFYFRLSIQPLIVKVLDTVVDHAPHVLKDIDDTYALLAHLKPDVVLLDYERPDAFVILARVARDRIPSLEMQHAIRHGPGFDG
jgi:hypothetical protein